MVDSLPEGGPPRFAFSAASIPYEGASSFLLDFLPGPPDCGGPPICSKNSRFQKPSSFLFPLRALLRQCKIF